MGLKKYIGERFGRLIAIEFVGKDNNKRRLFNCVCDCGNKVVVTDSNLGRHSKSCGCLKKELAKTRFGKSAEHKIKTIKNWENKNKRWLKPESREKALLRVRRYREKNRNKINDRHRYKMKNDVNYSLKWNIRNRFKQALLKNYNKGAAIANLGCSISQLKEHLEKLFKPGMTWENYGFNGWHIDHIRPLSSFILSDLSEVAIACHYSNLQPLWAKENLSKGGKYES